jgi:hypothetical protein
LAAGCGAVLKTAAEIDRDQGGDVGDSKAVARLPEHGVVGVAASIIADCGADRFGQLAQLASISSNGMPATAG